jgi:hypothetical protein
MVASWRSVNLRIWRASRCCILATCGGLLLPLQASLAAGATVRAVFGRVVASRDGVENPFPVRGGDELHDADRLQGDSPDASTQLECPSGATQTLTGRFDAVLNPSGAQSDCAIDLNVGTAIATTGHSPRGVEDDPKSALIKSGPIAMTSHHTQFGLEVLPTRKRGIPHVEGFVLDGSAACHDLQTGRQWRIETGKKIDMHSRVITPVEDAKYVRLARAFARLDLSQKGAAAIDPASERTLQTRWLAVMRQPQDAAARVNLIEAHVSLKVSASRVSVYQASRANVLIKKSVDPALKIRWKSIGAPVGANVVMPPTDMHMQAEESESRVHTDAACDGHGSVT